MNILNSGFDKTLNEIKVKQQKMVEKSTRGPVTEEESKRIKEAFREAAHYLIYNVPLQK
ncbi:MAG: hypothetical protein AAB377_00075 [Patescibacteria group bacterium]